MKPILLAIPSFLALATGGGLLALALHAANQDASTPGVGFIHAVTHEMVVGTSQMASRPAPKFSVTSVSGEQLTIGAPTRGKPQFVYFINDGCPCSFTAEPLFHALAKQFQGAVDFIGVTNVDVAGARRWIREMIVPYNVVPDPKLEIMKAYGAKSSAYSAIVGTDGRISRMWPGVSRDYLLEMNHELARAAGVKQKEFDTEYAPLRPATGCTF